MYSWSLDRQRGRGVGRERTRGESGGREREREREGEREIVAGRKCDGVTHTSKHFCAD